MFRKLCKKRSIFLLSFFSLSSLFASSWTITNLTGETTLTNFYPQIVMNLAGDKAAAAWTRTPSPGNLEECKGWTLAGGWDALSSLQNAAIDFSLFIDPSGTNFGVAFVGPTFVSDIIFNTNWTAGDYQLNNGSPGLNLGNRLKTAIANPSTILTVWITHPSNSSFTLVGAISDYDPGSQVPHTISTTSPVQIADFPRVAMNTSSQAIVVFEETILNPYDIGVKAVTWDSINSWSSSVLLSANTQQDHFKATNPRIAVDASGNGVAIWSQTASSPSSTQLIYGKRYTFSTHTWDATATLLSAGNVSANSPELAIDPVGNAVIVWQQSNSADCSLSAVMSRRWFSNNSLSAIDQISDYGLMPDDSVKVAINTSDEIIAVWSRKDDQYGKLVVQNAIRALAWSPPQDISENTQDSTEPGVVLDNSGNAMTIWAHSTSQGGAYIQSARSTDLFTPPPSPVLHGSLFKNRFVTQNDLINELNWQASPGAVRYLVFRNGLLIATVSASSPLVYLDHNRKPGGPPATYQVFAVNEIGLESASNEITLP